VCDLGECTVGLAVERDRLVLEVQFAHTTLSAVGVQRLELGLLLHVRDWKLQNQKLLEHVVVVFVDFLVGFDQDAVPLL